jgi:hypothetical protein
VRHLPRDKYELVADHGRHKPEVGAEATPGGWIWWISYLARGITAISEVDIVDWPPKQRSITTDVLGAM